MTLLLAKQAPGDAHELVVGAVGGMELKAIAEAQPNWRFTGVDPSPAMLGFARKTLQPFADRIVLIQGTVDAASAGPFDGATCLLTLHHLDRDERRRTLKGIRRRRRSGAKLVVAEHSAPGPDPERWMTRSVAFGEREGLDWTTAAAKGRMMMERLPLLTPDQQEDLLRDAGFADVELFCVAFSFRGWVGTAR